MAKGIDNGLVPRNALINGRRTSMRLEGPIWDALDEIAQREGMKLNALLSQIENRYLHGPGAAANLSSAIRIFVAGYYRAASTEAGHRLAGHGCGEPLAATLPDPRPDPPAEEPSRKKNRRGRPRSEGRAEL